MSQRPQRAAAVQAIKANAAALAPRRRSDSQTSNKTITSPHIKNEERKFESRSSPSMDVVMQRSSHHDLRRHDSMANPSGFVGERDITSAAYDPNGYQMSWTAQDDSGAMGTGASYYQQQLWQEAVPEQHGISYHDQTANPNAFDLHYGYAAQENSLGLKQDSGLHVGINGELDLRDSMHSDQKPLDTSDSMALLDSLPFQATSSADNDSYEDSTDSDLPPEKKKLSAAFRPRGRKKRNKCTPDQLRSLEAFFEKNRNPTGRIRLELSRKLRMPERSVQVWFQNRRAKVKTIERRGDIDPELARKKSCSIRLNEKDTFKSMGSDGRARDANDQTPSVTAIPTSALCIGTWRRVSPLICFFSRRLQSMTWYLTSESIGFKLEVPWTSIRSAYFDGPFNPSIAERAEGVRVPLGHFVIDLHRPPTFFMEVFRSAPVPLKNGTPEQHKVSWRQCEDFTEDHQATNISRHILNGPYEELRSAIQALARCNGVLQRLIVFRDTDLRAARAVPTASGMAADNFGMATGMSMRGADAFASPMDATTALAPVDVYGNAMQMPLQPAAMSSGSSVHKSSAWQTFRTPLRPGEAAGWEFDSPASVSTNLSEASLDSSQRHHLSPYGVPSSIEASPRSGLGSSVDLGSLRIDTGAMANFGVPQPNMAMLGGGGGSEGGGFYAAPRQTQPFDGGWDGRLSYGMDTQQSESQYSFASSSGVVQGGQASTQPMQGQGMDASFGMGQMQSQSDRIGGERSEYSNYANSNNGNYTGASLSELPPSPGEARSAFYDHQHEPVDSGGGTADGSLSLSRRFSATGTVNATGQSEYPPAESKGSDDISSSSRRATVAGVGMEEQRRSSVTHLAPPSIDGSTSRMAALDEDVFSGATPTLRTSFGARSEIPHMSALSTASASGSGNNDDAHAHHANGYESDKEDPAQGRARSNTYRPAMHGAGAGVGSWQPQSSITGNMEASRPTTPAVAAAAAGGNDPKLEVEVEPSAATAAVASPAMLSVPNGGGGGETHADLDAHDAHSRQ